MCFYGACYVPDYFLVKYRTSLGWYVSHCMAADSVLPPCGRGLSVFLGGVSVWYEAGNGELAVALGEGRQQTGPGLLVPLWTRGRRHLNESTNTPLKFCTAKSFSSGSSSSVEDTGACMLWSLQTKRRGNPDETTCAFWKKRDCTSKSFVCNIYFSVVGFQTPDQLINWA